MIPRWMPYSTPIYIEQLSSVFQRLRTQQNGEDLDETCEKLEQE